MTEPAATLADMRARLEEAATRNPPAGGDLFLRCADHFLRRGPLDLYRGMTPDDLLAFLLERFQRLQARGKAPFLVHLGASPPVSWHGDRPFLLVEAVLDDRPFLVDSVKAFLQSRRLKVRVAAHPILTVRRDATGNLTALDAPGGAGQAESHMMFLLEDPATALSAGDLEADLGRVLHDVMTSVDEFPALQERLSAAQTELAGHAVSLPYDRLLAWLDDSNFIFLGYMPFNGTVAGDGTLHGSAIRREEGLGLFNPSASPAGEHGPLIAEVTQILNQVRQTVPFVTVAETQTTSTVHRRQELSAVLWGLPAPEGQCRGGICVGLFTNHSLRVPALTIPAVREKIITALDRFALVPGSHVYKESLDFFDGIPKFDLFRLSPETLSDMLAFFLELMDHPREAHTFLRDDDGNVLRVLIAQPGEWFPPEHAARVRARLEDLLGTTARAQFPFRVGNLCLLGLVFQEARSTRWPPRDLSAADGAITEELLSQDDRLIAAWRREGPTAGDVALARAYVEALPAGYKVALPPAEIVADLARLEALATSGRPQFALTPETGNGRLRMTLVTGEMVSLSRIMPVLSNFRVDTLEEQAHHVPLPDRPAFLQTFILQDDGGGAVEVGWLEEQLRQMVPAMLDGQLENDPLNALLFTAGFDWRQINLVMLLRNYLVQVGTVYTIRTVNETLIAHRKTTRALFGVFEARFSPEIASGRRSGAEGERVDELTEALREIYNLTEDRIYKGLLNIIQAGVRTNYYQEPLGPVLALKLKSGAVDQLPPPHPLYETLVHAPLVEGIHLRGGMIARGGIRYSDRQDDFRTEVLDLMWTQMKKNAMILPVGSKGGFVVKDLGPYGGDARRAGDEQYEVFMGALLSVTDNLVRGEIVPPQGVVRHDGDDPYLVVAADKGTAHLSDTANRIAVKRGFWLGDAFASGGSNGYNHKTVGITAKGAWESVKRHFWERGVNIQQDPVRVVGIGDMSGDVFGNGMLLSRALRLVAAFNHRHIFLDPDPDPERSFAERERLFNEVRDWEAYDPAVISPGGGVFPRTAKAIALSPQVQALLGIAETALSGEALIRALLALDVDLLWNGGIGTYIKAPNESHGDVGDAHNDAVRVDADEVRARVVGEGGNLGLTQSARFDLDLAGCALNTDAIDNAAGVNMSDHEVNLKILLTSLHETGHLPDEAARNSLLHEMEGAVSAACIRENYLQTVLLSMDRERSRGDVQPFVRLINTLAAGGMMDRRTEAMPGPQRLEQLQASRHGIPRPVLAVLLSFSKMALFDRLEAGRLLEDPHLKQYHVGYFPEVLARTYPLAETPHRLERKLIATVVTNKVVDQAGMTFVPETAAATGRAWDEVAGAYLLADHLLEGDALRESIYALDYRMPADDQHRILMDLEDTLAHLTRWMLLQWPPEERTLAALPSIRADLDAFRAAAPEARDAETRAELEAAAQHLTAAGLPGPHAEAVATLAEVKQFPESRWLAAAWELPLGDAMTCRAEVERHFCFDALEASLAQLLPADAWERQFTQDLAHTLRRRRQERLEAILDGRAPETRAEQGVADYLAAHEEPWRAYQSALRQFLAQEQPSLLQLAVVVGKLEAW